MRKRRTAAVISVLVLVLAGSPAERAEAAAAARAAPGPMVIKVPASAVAGIDIPVIVTGEEVGATINLLAIGSIGSTALNAVATPIGATFVLPSSFTRASGTVTLLATSAAVTARASVTLRPGTAVGPVQAIVGARSIVADGADTSMVVAIPMDRWGNAISDGAGVQVSRTTPAGKSETARVLVNHLLAWWELKSGTVAGRGEVWVAAQGATGQSVSLDEVAGTPAPFTLSPVDPGLAAQTGADGQTLVPVRTSVLHDRFGNVEPDGTLVSMEWQTPQGRATAQAATVAGVAELSLQAPTVPAVISLTGYCRGTTTSRALALTFHSVVRRFPLVGSRSGNDIDVRVGPVNRAGGTFVPDGTIADVVVADRTGRRVTGSGGLVNGEVVLTLPAAGLVGAAGTVTVTVLGTSSTAAVQ